MSQEASQLEINDIILDYGWDWDKPSFDLPVEIKMLIQATLIAFTTRGSNKLAWAGSSHVTFDLKSAYKFFLGSDSNTSFDANWIWKADTLPVLKHFCGCALTIALELWLAL